MRRKKNQVRKDVERKHKLQAIGILNKTQSSQFYQRKGPNRQYSNIYFDCSMMNQPLQPQPQDNPLHFYQSKISTLYDRLHLEQWDLYVRKSAILPTSRPHIQLQLFLLKSLLKALKKPVQQVIQTSQILRNSMVQNSSQRKWDVSSKAKQSSEQVLKYELVVVQKQLEQYGSKLEEYERKFREMEGRKRVEDGQERDQLRELEQEREKKKYKSDSQTKDLQIDALNRELRHARDIIEAVRVSEGRLQQSLQQLEGQYEKLKKNLVFGDLWRMAVEEGETWRQMYGEQRVENERAQKKIHILKDKNKQLLTYFNMSNVFNVEQEEDKLNLQKIIKEFKEWLQVVSVPKVSYPHAETDINYRVLRPNFYIYFQAYEETILMEKNVLNVQPIDSGFFPRIRAMMDGMYSQFILNPSWREWQAFPEFVVGFLGKYDIDAEGVKVRSRPVESQERLTFLINLFNTNLCNSWECEIFRNCLLEHYSLDEVYFFLESRNILNGGVGVQHNLGLIDQVCYVKLERALHTVGVQLAPYQLFISDKVKNLIRSKKKIKHGIEFVDKFFVLKVLLQVYVLERSKSERIFQSSFAAKAKKSFISFHDYTLFMSRNFSFLSHSDIACLYRTTYQLSSGHVTAKCMHYVCSNKGLFIKLLRDKRAEGSEKPLSQDMVCLKVQNVFGRGAGFLRAVEECSAFQSELNMFMRQIDHHCSSRQGFYGKLLQQQINVMKANAYLMVQAMGGQPVTKEEAQAQVETLHYLVCMSQQHVAVLHKTKEIKNAAIHMLSRNFKIRIQESILQFHQVNRQTVKKIKEEVGVNQ